MSDAIAAWPRPAYQPSSSIASVTLFAFSEQPLRNDIPLSATRFGIPHQADLSVADVRTHDRNDDPAWFDGFRSGALRAMADKDLTDPDRLDAAAHCHSVLVDVADPPSLAHLQIAWGLCGWLVACGSFAVLDAHATRWHDADVIAALEPDREFQLGSEVVYVFETDATPGFGHALHTRGMVKMARPDLVAASDPAAAPADQQILEGIALGLAAGGLATAGQLVQIGDRMARLDTYQPGVNAPELNLNNEGLLIAFA